MINVLATVNSRQNFEFFILTLRWNQDHNRLPYRFRR